MFDYTKESDIREFFQSTMDYVHLRMHVDLDLTDVFEKLGSKYPYLIVSREVGERVHFHCLIGSDSKTLGRDNQNLTNYVKKTFGVKNNSMYSCVTVRERKQLMKYLLKDGLYLVKGFGDDQIQNIKNLSYKKYKKASFAKELEAIRERFIVSKMSGNYLMTKRQAHAEISRLRSSYGQSYSPQTKNVVLGWAIGRDDYLADQLAAEAFPSE